MRLGPILFTERAPTAGEALASGVVGVFHHLDQEGFAVYLVNALPFREFVKKHGEAISRVELEEVEWTEFSVKQDPEEIVRGYVEVHKLKGTTNLYSVKYSVGIEKYGPLAYRIAMEAVKAKKGWLRSDSYVSKDASRVWNKMFELSEHGVYKRRFLGEFGKLEVTKSLGTVGLPRSINPPTKRLIERVVDEAVGPEMEKRFLEVIAKVGVLPTQVGWFWAYQTTRKDPQSSKLLSGGENLLLAAGSESPVPIGKAKLELLIDRFASKLFSRRFV